jgi:TolA-binding protein
VEILAAIGGLTSAGLAITVAIMAIRLSGAKTDAADADRERHNANKQLAETAHELATYRKRTQRQFAALREDIEQLEDDLESCATPGATRNRLERLLSKAADRENGGDAASLPDRGGTSA